MTADLLGQRLDAFARAWGCVCGESWLCAGATSATIWEMAVQLLDYAEHGEELKMKRKPKTEIPNDVTITACSCETTYATRWPARPSSP